MPGQAALDSVFADIIAAEIGCRAHQVRAAGELFADGATVPFVARYRKEATGGLGDDQLEIIAKRRLYFLELAARRETILSSIGEQGKLSAELERAIRSATSKQERGWLNRHMCASRVVRRGVRVTFAQPNATSSGVA